MKRNKKSPPVIGEWEWCASCVPDYMMRERQWKVVTFGVYKFHQEPEHGERETHGKHYRGFIFRFAFWFPIIIHQWR